MGHQTRQQVEADLCHPAVLLCANARIHTGVPARVYNGSFRQRRNERLRTSDYFYYYQTLKASFLHDHNNYSPDNRPDPADSKNWADWSKYAESLMIEKDHLFQVATITKGQIKKLNQDIK